MSDDVTLMLWLNKMDVACDVTSFFGPINLTLLIHNKGT